MVVRRSKYKFVAHYILFMQSETASLAKAVSVGESSRARPPMPTDADTEAGEQYVWSEFCQCWCLTYLRDPESEEETDSEEEARREFLLPLERALARQRARADPNADPYIVHPDLYTTPSASASKSVYTNHQLSTPSAKTCVVQPSECMMNKVSADEFPVTPGFGDAFQLSLGQLESEFDPSPPLDLTDG